MPGIFLVRHGRPQTPDNRRYCLGNGSDFPLAPEGLTQSSALIPCFSGMEYALYCSRLRRSRETAERLATGKRKISVSPGLDEIAVGEWEGMRFEAIRARYPELYARRGRNWALMPPGGESLDSGATRMETTLREIAEREGSDIVAITHEGAIRALLWKLMHLDPRHDALIRLPYGSITVLRYANGAFAVTATGKSPDDIPSDEEIRELWRLCATPEPVRAHSLAVCEEALRISTSLQRDGIILSPGRLRAAALLHDMARREGKSHPHKAAAILRARGYLQVARIVELHHDITLSEPISEAHVLFLADKRMYGTKKVTLQERFTASMGKCLTKDAVLAHDDRWQQALAIEKAITNRVK
ncbi:histidine phosphatase family protein [Klebsiella sp. 2680]|uniref:histidine phosphatase family protein n=1 Tax=Klebsiella sp. 2680 TaxID=2018037 RepID=UPI001159AA8F|nr:histidine phosphatase family protein [Klebsiella sp. 2680]